MGSQGNGAIDAFLSPSEASSSHKVVKHGSEFLLSVLRDQRSVSLSHSHHRSQILNTLAAWKGLTRVNHAVTEAGAAEAGAASIGIVSWHDFREMGTSLGEGQSPSQICAPQAGRGQWAEKK